MEAESKKYNYGSTEKNSATIEIESVIKRIVESKTSDVTSIIHNIRTWLKDMIYLKLNMMIW